MGDDLWGALRWVADTEGVTVSELLRRIAAQYVKESAAMLDASLTAYGRRKGSRRGGRRTPPGTPPGTPSP